MEKIHIVSITNYVGYLFATDEKIYVYIFILYIYIKIYVHTTCYQYNIGARTCKYIDENILRFRKMSRKMLIKRILNLCVGGKKFVS